MKRIYHINEGCLNIDYLVLGPLENNVYIISSDRTTVLVDPSCTPQTILEALAGRNVEAIILTHYHYDHVGAAATLAEALAAPVVATRLDAAIISGEQEAPSGHTRVQACTVDQKVDHGDVIEVGDIPFKVIHTPGHTPGSMCLFVASAFGNNPQGRPILISGDTLFEGSIGRCDFADGNIEDMRQSLKRLAVLPDDTLVLPGHGFHTTIGAERQRVFARFA